MDENNKDVQAPEVEVPAEVTNPGETAEKVAPEGGEAPAEEAAA